MAVDPALYAQALAELRALRAPTEKTPRPEGCCTGDRRGYQRHQREHRLPACEASRRAAAAYMARYQKQRPRRRGKPTAP